MYILNYHEDKYFTSLFAPLYSKNTVKICNYCVYNLMIINKIIKIAQFY